LSTATAIPLLNIARLPLGPPASLKPWALGLSPYRLLLVGMSVGSLVKTIIWSTFIDEKRLPPSAALIAAGWNILVNSINCLLATLPLTSPGNSPSESLIPLSVPVAVGVTLYVVGTVLELGSETQRKVFKSDKRNQGKVYKDGLFSLARHVNFGGYTFWRTGFTLVGGGWWPASAFFAFQWWLFSHGGIPALDNYCSKRYGQQWVDYKRQTPWKLWWRIY